MGRDTAGESEDFLERMAICMEDGGLSRADALKIADAQLWTTIRRKSTPNPDALKRSAKWIPAGAESARAAEAASGSRVHPELRAPAGALPGEARPKTKGPQATS